MNITLIGMAGAGKSFIGKMLADKLNYSFTDVDEVIEQNNNSKLQPLIDKFGDDKFIELEEKAILSLELSDNSIIATGGSAIYGEDAMIFLKKNSKVIFLDADLKGIKKHLTNADTRGIVGIQNGLDNLFKKRKPIYQKYADITITMEDFDSLETISKEIIKRTNTTDI